MTAKKSNNSRSTKALESGSALKSKKLMKVNFHMVDESDDVRACLNCMFEHHGLCSVHRVRVPNFGKCDDFD